MPLAPLIKPLCRWHLIPNQHPAQSLWLQWQSSHKVLPHPRFAKQYLVLKLKHLFNLAADTCFGWLINAAAVNLEPIKVPQKLQSPEGQSCFGCIHGTGVQIPFPAVPWSHTRREISALGTRENSRGKFIARFAMLVNFLKQGAHCSVVGGKSWALQRICRWYTARKGKQR